MVEELHQLWKTKAGERIAPYMEKARETLLDASLKKDQNTTKVTDGSRSAADYILKEARNKRYGTIVLGRHGQSAMKQFIFGSVTSNIIHHSVGLAIWVVQ
jgi:nucleotide-binding universal stress UspA family protein